MYSQTHNEKRIKRLEIAVVILSVLLLITSTAAVYSAIQIRTVASSIPSYKEIKEDIKTLNALYKVSEEKLPKAYNYTKDKTVKAYDYTKEKTNELIQYLKEKTEDKKTK
jgi:hypothetical protein